MSLSHKEVIKTAQLAKLTLSDGDLALYTEQLSSILNFIEDMNTVNTDAIEPLSHPYEMTQRLRPDIVTEEDQRDHFQAIAPAVDAGLYLVPKVIEEA